MKLSDVCFEMHQGINTVADKVKYYECGTPILQSKNITNGILDLEDVRFVNENDYNKYKEKYIPHKGDILLSNIGTIGKSLLIEEEKKFLIAWNIFLIKVNESKINSKFLNFYFQYLDMSNYYNKYLTGGTVKFINKKTMENIEIPNISLVNQIEIANKLEKVQKMIDIRKKQIEELDKLIKSQFVEMFENKNYEKLSGKELFSFSSGKFLEASKRLENGVPVYGGNGVAWYTDEPLIDFNTIVIGRVGAYCGNVKLIKEPVWITDNAIFIKQFKKDVYNIDFLYYMMELVDFSRFAQFSGQPKITQKPLEEFNYVVPPIEEQIKFSNIVKQIDKQKFEIQKSLEETQKLQESLMNKYFGE